MDLTRRDWLSLAAAAPQAPAYLSNDAELRRLAAGAPLRLRFAGKTPADARQWQAAFAAKLRQMLGPFAPPMQWTTTVERSLSAPDHTRHELLLSAPGVRPLPVHLLLPPGNGRHPAVLALHGHGAFGHDSIAGIDSTEERRTEIAALKYDYGLQLVRRGYAVACPCFTPFGRRLAGDPPYGKGLDACGITYMRMQLLGKLLIAENLRDAIWSLDLLARHERVDASRLGCAGLSYGGRMTMLTTAVEPRIKVAVIAGALNVMQERIEGRYGCGAQVIPGLLEYGDIPEIGGLIAPRPALWQAGRSDKLMDPKWSNPAAAQIRRVYDAMGAGNRFELDWFDGAHEFHRETGLPFLDAVLEA